MIKHLGIVHTMEAISFLLLLLVLGGVTLDARQACVADCSSCFRACEKAGPAESDCKLSCARAKCTCCAISGHGPGPVNACLCGGKR